MGSRRKVAIGLLGTTLDQGKSSRRWEKWRPSVSLCQNEDLLIDRFELLYQLKFKKLAQLVVHDIARVSPETKVELREVEPAGPAARREFRHAGEQRARSALGAETEKGSLNESRLPFGIGICIGHQWIGAPQPPQM